MHWLRDRLQEVDGLTRAYLFGSFQRGKADPKDVDLIVVFDHRNAVDNLFDLCSAFNEQFGLPLHLQKFYEQQSDLIDCFLKRADAWEKIYG